MVGVNNRCDEKTKKKKRRWRFTGNWSGLLLRGAPHFGHIEAKGTPPQSTQTREKERERVCLNRKSSAHRREKEAENAGERRRRQMEESMRECMRKLALWHTRTFKPIMTHDELEPLMATLGFVGLTPSASAGGAVAWKEYAYSPIWRRRSGGGGCCRSSDGGARPRPRLPYPRIDGLHSYTYQAFVDGVNSYLEMCDISVLFHIRGMPLHRLDLYKKWRRMQEDESVFVYREGTLDQATYNLYHFDHHDGDGGGGGDGSSSLVIRDKGNSAPVSFLVPLKDIIL
ncbi:uncharacterized protein LOC115756843 [Rhodamnia argentea]|uniref:Uncharacterized protein LOC115756843 n=1 Tax=Rhodamnia argentea TaxID=178133 RepID=A0ABM3GVU4_9MYRT|nr:uncharacterized protein LOC115756843 [Rhodamnia argentea]